ncbi:MAG: alpha-ketoglutarate-dependent dioxygenase AlkB [Actinomycetota bacterium]
MHAYQTTLFALGEPSVTDRWVTRHHLDELCWVDHADGWLAGADDLLADLAETLPWRAGRRPMYGKLVDEPRLHATIDPQQVARRRILAEIPAALEARYGEGLTCGFVNYYRNGDDSVAWHADRIGMHEVDPIVAIVSLGGPRRFSLRPMQGDAPSHRFVLNSGDLLVMGGACQHAWEHAVPKMRSAPPRMSLTYRHIPDGPNGVWWSDAITRQDRLAHRH